MWAVLAVLHAVTMACVNVLDKYVLTRIGRGPLLPLLILVPLGLVPIPVIFLARGLPPASPDFLLLAVLAGGAFTASTLFYFSAAGGAEISRVVPLFYLSPVFVALAAAAFLGEVFGPARYLGLALIVAGAMVVGGGGAPAAPGSRLRGRLTGALGKMVLAALFLAAYIVLTKELVLRSDAWDAFASTRVAMALWLVPFYALRGRDLAATVRSLRPPVAGAMAASEALALTALFLATAAVSLGPATLVSGLTALQPVFVLGLAVAATRLGHGVIGEDLSPRAVRTKVAAVALMFLGAVLVAG